MPAPTLSANSLTPTTIQFDVRTHFKVGGLNLGDNNIRTLGSIVLRTLIPATGIEWDPIQSTDIDNLTPDDQKHLYFWATCHQTPAAPSPMPAADTGLIMTDAGNVQVTVTNGSGTAQRTYSVVYPAPPPPPPISPMSPQPAAQPHIGITQTVFTRGEVNPFAIYGDNMEDVDTANGVGSIEILDDSGCSWRDVEATWDGGNRVKVRGTPPEAPDDDDPDCGCAMNTQVIVTNGSGQPAVLSFPATYI